eukprot:g31969.t1
MTTIKKILAQHVAAGDAKPAAITNGNATQSFAPKPRGFTSTEEDNGFDVNQDFSKVPDFDGMTLASKCLVRLCEQGNLTVAAELIQAKADLNLPEPDIGVTPLIAAANAGHLDVCKYLRLGKKRIRKSADISAEVRDGTRRTALHAAALMGYASVVQLLLDKGANPKVEDLTRTHPLHLAVKNGHAGAAELLLKSKANPNSADEQGHVAINDAVAKDRFDLVTKLLEYGALVNVRNMAGLEAISFSRTPQMQSIIMKHDVQSAVSRLRQEVPQLAEAAAHRLMEGLQRRPATPPSAPPPPPPDPMPDVSENDQIPAKLFELPGLENVIGRSTACDTCIPGSQAISNRHMCISFASDGTASIRDIGSRNGTFLNDHRVAGTALVMKSGDKVQLGVDGPSYVFTWGPAYYARWPRELQRASVPAHKASLWMLQPICVAIWMVTLRQQLGFDLQRHLLEVLLLETFDYQAAFLRISSTSHLPDPPEPQEAVSAEWTLEMNDFYLAVPLKEVPQQPASELIRQRCSWLHFDTVLQRRH